MSEPLRVVHYLNQFFAGVGGEGQAGLPPETRPGPVGPGRLLQAQLGARATVVGTVVCGDNFFNERQDEAREQSLALIAEWRPDVVVAGPAFNAGRYGLACGAIGQAARQRLGVPAVTGLFPENPAVELYRRHVWIVPAGDSAAGMGEVMPRLAALALKLGARIPLGPALDEGYLPQGYRWNGFADEIAARRAVKLLLAKLAGAPYASELPLPASDQVAPPPPVQMAAATLALVTEGGIVPLGNPDRLEAGWAPRYLRYSLAGLDDLSAATHQSIHGGYDTAHADADPDRVLPVDAVRAAERLGAVGRLFDTYYVTAGMAGPVANASRFGRDIARELRESGVQAVILTAT